MRSVSCLGAAKQSKPRGQHTSSDTIRARVELVWFDQSPLYLSSELAQNADLSCSSALLKHTLPKRRSCRRESTLGP